MGSAAGKPVIRPTWNNVYRGRASILAKVRAAARGGDVHLPSDTRWPDHDRPAIGGREVSVGLAAAQQVLTTAGEIFHIGHTDLVGPARISVDLQLAVRLGGGIAVDQQPVTPLEVVQAGLDRKSVV